MLVDRGGDRIGQQGVAAHDAHPGLVAGALDAEDERFGGGGRGHPAIVPPTGPRRDDGRDSVPELSSPTSRETTCTCTTTPWPWPTT